MPGVSAGGARPRMGGGFNTGAGGGLNEHLDENAMQQAMGQKQLSQQSANQQSSLQSGQGGQKAQTDFSKLQSGDVPPRMEGMSGGMPGAKNQNAREVGSLKDELLVRPVQDIIAGLKSFFDVNALLGIDPQTDSPQTQAKKRQLHQRWQKLDQEQQQVAQQNYQKEMQKKQAEEEEKQQRKQQEAAQNNTIQAPSSPQKGPKGPGGSKKQKAVTKLQNDRKSLGGPSGSN